MEEREFLRATLPTVVLRLLADREDHGYGLAQRIRERSHDLLSPGEGTLYPVLHRLEREQLITAEWTRSSSNRRVKLYRLTPTGTEALAQRRRDWLAISRALDDMLRLAAAGGVAFGGAR